MGADDDVDDEDATVRGKQTVAIPARAAHLKALRLGDYNRVENWSEVYEAQQRLSDEEACARVLAARGEPLYREWAKDEDDPRLLAWRSVFDKTLVALADRVRDWRSELNEDRLSAESLHRLFVAASEIWQTVQRILPNPEVPRERPPTAGREGPVRVAERAPDGTPARLEPPRSALQRIADEAGRRAADDERPF